MNNRDSSETESIRKLLLKGMRKLDLLYYIGIIVGLLLGPLIVISSYIPAVTDIVAQSASDHAIMRYLGIGMTILLSLATFEQIAKKATDRYVLTSIDNGFADVVWIFKEGSTIKYRGISASKGTPVARYTHVNIMFAEGKHIKIWLNEAESDQLITLIKRNFNNISTGYSNNTVKMYKENPMSLKMKPTFPDAVYKTSTSNVRT